MGFERDLEQWFTKKMGRVILELGNKTASMGMESIALEEATRVAMCTEGSLRKTSKQGMGFTNTLKAMSTMGIGKRTIKRGLAE